MGDKLKGGFMSPNDDTGFDRATLDIIRLMRAYIINPDGLMHYANLILAKNKDKELKRNEPQKGG